MVASSSITCHVTKLKQPQTGFVDKTMSSLLKWPPQSPDRNPVQSQFIFAAEKNICKKNLRKQSLVRPQTKCWDTYNPMPIHRLSFLGLIWWILITTRNTLPFWSHSVCSCYCFHHISSSKWLLTWPLTGPIVLSEYLVFSSQMISSFCDFYKLAHILHWQQFLLN